MAFSKQFSFHIHTWRHTRTCGSCLAASVPHEDSSGVLRWSKALQISAWTYKWLWGWGNFLWQDTWAPPAKVTLSKARWLSKCTLAERGADTNRGYPVTMCQVCWQGWGQAGLCEWQLFLSNPGSQEGSLHPQPPHGPAIWEELVLPQQLLETTHGTGNTLCQPPGIRSGPRAALVSRSPRRSHADCSCPTASSGCWAVCSWLGGDLSGHDQLPPAASADKRPLWSPVEPRTAAERAMLLLRN